VKSIESLQPLLVRDPRLLQESDEEYTLNAAKLLVGDGALRACLKNLRKLR
jgi:hypothetical protein